MDPNSDEVHDETLIDIIVSTTKEYSVVVRTICIRLVSVIFSHLNMIFFSTT